MQSLCVLLLSFRLKIVKEANAQVMLDVFQGL